MMKNHGFALVGAGINGAVFKNPKYSYVIKVYRNDPGFDEWMNFSKSHQNNVYVPRVKGNAIRLNGIFTAIRMEPLVPCPEREAADFIEKLDEVKNTLEKKQSWSGAYYANNETYKNRILNNEELLASYKPDLVELAKYLIEWEGSTDVSTHNIMCRPDGDIVIIDAIYIDPEPWINDSANWKD